MANEICIGLDLGSDTLKIAYASGSDKCGKFLDDKHSLNVAVPAVAYYDRAAGKWIYGDGVDSGERSFINVVKIKALISMLIDRPEAPTVVKKNREYYADGSRFPKFCFPARRKILSHGTMFFPARNFLLKNAPAGGKLAPSQKRHRRKETEPCAAP